MENEKKSEEHWQEICNEFLKKTGDALDQKVEAVLRQIHNDTSKATEESLQAIFQKVGEYLQTHSKEVPTKANKRILSKEQFDPKILPGDYPPVCEPYLPVMKRIEMDTIDLLASWDTLVWDVNLIEKNFPNAGVIRFKIQGDKTQIVKETLGYHTRVPSIIRLVTDSVAKHPIVPEVEFMYDTGDYLHNPNYPHFAFAKKPKDPKFVTPDFTFYHWNETRVGPWKAFQKTVQQFREKNPLAQRLNRAFWIGYYTLGNRGPLVELSKKHPDILEARFMDWNDQSTFVPMLDHCKYKYLVHTGGNSYSARLKYLMSCGSVLIYQKQEFQEFFYHLLENGVNMYAVEWEWTDLIERLEDLRKRPDSELQKVADAAVRLMEEQLNTEAVHCYFATALRRYALLAAMATK